MPDRFRLCFLLIAFMFSGLGACSSPSDSDTGSTADMMRADAVDLAADMSAVEVQADLFLPDTMEEEAVAEDATAQDMAADQEDEDVPLCQCFADSDCDLMVPSGPCSVFVCDENCSCTETSAADDAPCVPQDPCFLEGVCTAGECDGTVVLECNDDNPCTLDDCLAGVGCEFAEAEGECDDGDPCTDSDQCHEGECKGEETVCDDDNLCTDDSCDPLAGCIFTDNDEPCDDNDACTEGDSCFNGDCAPGLDICECHEDDDCLFLLEENMCYGDVQCELDAVPYSCKATEPVQCEQSTTICSMVVCDPETGECGAVADNEGDECFEPDNCVDEGVCQEGVCVGEASVCSDLNPCTLDVCMPGQGCVFEPKILPCDDSDPCTINDFCTLAGECMGQDIGCGEVPSRGFRLTSLVFEEPGFCLPAGDAGCLDATAVVNSFVQDDINAADNPLVMLGAFDPFDLYGESSEFFLGPGECEDGEPAMCSYVGQPASMAPVEYEDAGECVLGGGLQSVAPCFSVMGGQLVVGIMTISVPLVDSSVSGTFMGMPEPHTLEQGHIRAFLKKSVADTIKVTFPLMPTYYLSELLPEDKLDSYDGDDGWVFVIHFSASLIDFQ